MQFIIYVEQAVKGSMAGLRKANTLKMYLTLKMFIS